MTAMASRSTDAPVPLGEYVPTADRRLVLHGLDWAAFQTLLALRGERLRHRMAYLDGAVEIMGLSREHEWIKSGIGRLLEAYCLERDVAFTPFGSWLQADQSKEAGAMPDECYIFGSEPQRKARPDLVIEVVWTSGGLDKLEIYRRLGIAEVWFWKNDAISVHVLESDGYVVRAASARVPGIDLELVCRLACIQPVSDAIRQLRESFRA
jgi:Uma2 family endonuclease